MKMKQFLFVVLMLGVLLLLSGCCINHEWQDATCTLPVTCAKCEKTEGESLGHTWQEATCVTPKTCEVCGETEGDGLGHEWNEATCLSAKTCSVCWETSGNPLGHNWGEWDITQEATAIEWGIQAHVCKNCSLKEEKWYELEVLHENGHFIMSPSEFGERINAKTLGQTAEMYYNMNGMYCGLKGQSLTGKYSDYSRYDDDEAIGVVMFLSNSGIMGISEKDSKTVNGLSTKFFTRDSDKIVDSMLGLIKACDGSLDDSMARTVGKNIIKASSNGNISYQYNGINYVFTQRSDYYLFVITVA